MRYIITGAAGHLGSTILRQLEARGAEANCLLLPHESAKVANPQFKYFAGDVCDKDSLRPLFESAIRQDDSRDNGRDDGLALGGDGGQGLTVIHTAALISIARKMPPHLHEVNVGGTQNVIELCREYAVKRLVHVSSVHAIPELPLGQTMREVGSFSVDAVEGGYAKTKAEAAQAVLDAAADGLDAVIVLPSGILGPFDDGSNHLIQMVRECMEGTLPACVKGGYDFVDVRDVADGCLRAASRGVKGETYLLSGRYATVQQLLALVARECNRGEVPLIPLPLAKLAVPFIEGYARLRHRRALYTGYSLHTLSSNSAFSHDKASTQLGYAPRALEETVADMVAWLRRDRVACCM